MSVARCTCKQCSTVNDNFSRLRTCFGVKQFECKAFFSSVICFVWQFCFKFHGQPGNNNLCQYNRVMVKEVPQLYYLATESPVVATRENAGISKPETPVRSQSQFMWILRTHVTHILCKIVNICIQSSIS